MHFQLPSTTAKRFFDSLGKRWGVTPAESESFSGRYYDTFDWRLYLNGLALFSEHSSLKPLLRLIDREGNNDLSLSECDCEPGMIDTLPFGALRERLTDVIEMRCLQPLVDIRGQRHKLSLVDDEEKTLVRLELTESRRLGEDGDEIELPLMIEIASLKGYEREAAKVVAWIERQPDVQCGEGSHLDKALAALGREGGDYSSKLNFKLRPEERTDSAAKHILLHLLNTLERNIEGTRRDIDSEYLHDLRVAVRRTRSALTQIKAVFEPHIVDRFKEEFAWIGRITGPTRDMDVYLLKLPDYRSSLPATYQDALEPFYRYVVDHQADEQRRLAQELVSERFSTTLAEWREFLAAPVPQVSSQANAVRPVLEVANDRIHRMYKRVMKEGRAINDDSEPEALHELRKSCKKLRYLMEFFQSLYPGNEIKSLIKAIKVLLDNLGDFQDLEVQAKKLEVMADELRRSRAKTHTLMAMGMLIDDLLRRQQQERERFASEFKQFSDKINGEAFKRLFKPAGGTES